MKDSFRGRTANELVDADLCAKASDETLKTYLGSWRVTLSVAAQREIARRNHERNPWGYASELGRECYKAAVAAGWAKDEAP